MRLELLVREATPECRELGVVWIGERVGKTTVRFFGRVEGRLLPAGTYALVVRKRSGETLSTVVVLRIRVVRRGNAPPAVLRLRGKPPACAAPAVAFTELGPPSELGGVATARAGESPARVDRREPSVLARAVDSFARSASAAPPWVGVLLLTTLLLVLLTIALAFVPPRMVPWPPLARALASWRSIRR
jgi:hypothetical protein